LQLDLGKMPSLDAMNKAAKSKKAPVPKKAEKKPATVSALSTEYVEDSDDESDGKESESEDDSLPEDPADALPKSNGKLPAPDGSESSSENESESEEESQEESGDDDEEEDSPKQTPQAVKPATYVNSSFSTVQ
jgi:hypothetical protein